MIQPRPAPEADLSTRLCASARVIILATQLLICDHVHLRSCLPSFFVVISLVFQKHSYSIGYFRRRFSDHSIFYRNIFTVHRLPPLIWSRIGSLSSHRPMQKQLEFAQETSLSFMRFSLSRFVSIVNWPCLPIPDCYRIY